MAQRRNLYCFGAERLHFTLAPTPARSNTRHRLQPGHTYTIKQFGGIQQTPVPSAGLQPRLVVPVARLVTLIAQTAPGPASEQPALVEQIVVGLHCAPDPLQWMPPSARFRHSRQAAVGHAWTHSVHGSISQQVRVPTGTPQP